MQISEKDRVKIACDVISGVVDFIKEGEREGGGGSFRHLIYDVLGFSHKYYDEFYRAGGMWLTNWIADMIELEGRWNDTI